MWLECETATVPSVVVEALIMPEPMDPDILTWTVLIEWVSQVWSPVLVDPWALESWP